MGARLRYRLFMSLDLLLRGSFAPPKPDVAQTTIRLVCYVLDFPTRKNLVAEFQFGNFFVGHLLHDVKIDVSTDVFRKPLQHEFQHRLAIQLLLRRRQARGQTLALEGDVSLPPRLPSL